MLSSISITAVLSLTIIAQFGAHATRLPLNYGNENSEAQAETEMINSHFSRSLDIESNDYATSTRQNYAADSEEDERLFDTPGTENNNSDLIEIPLHDLPIQETGSSQQLSEELLDDIQIQENGSSNDHELTDIVVTPSLVAPRSTLSGELVQLETVRRNNVVFVNKKLYFSIIFLLVTVVGGFLEGFLFGYNLLTKLNDLTPGIFLMMVTYGLKGAHSAANFGCLPLLLYVISFLWQLVVLKLRSLRQAQI